jgi:hypothetical protein
MNRWVLAHMYSKNLAWNASKFRGRIKSQPSGHTFWFRKHLSTFAQPIGKIVAGIRYSNLYHDGEALVDLLSDSSEPRMRWRSHEYKDRVTNDWGAPMMLALSFKWDTKEINESRMRRYSHKTRGKTITSISYSSWYELEESRHIWKWIRGTHGNDSWHTYEWIMGMGHGTHENASWHNVAVCCSVLQRSPMYVFQCASTCCSAPVCCSEL